jgi:hypothetical protein
VEGPGGFIEPDIADVPPAGTQMQLVVARAMILDSEREIHPAAEPPRILSPDVTDSRS